MLSPEEIDATYKELEKMFVSLDPRPELGLGYIRERLTLCRAMLDRAGELRLKVSQHTTDVLERHLIAQQTWEVQSTPDNKKRVKELEVLRQRHTGLAKMVGAQMQVLGRTAMDIRLLADITKQQMQRGEIDPREVPGMIKNVDPAEMAHSRQPSGPGPFTDHADEQHHLFVKEAVEAGEPETNPPTGPEPVSPFVTLDATRSEPLESSEPLGPDSFPGEDISSEPSPETMEAANEVIRSVRRPDLVPVEPAPTGTPLPSSQTVSFDGPVPGVPVDDDRVRLADTGSVSIDDLFEDKHGSTPAGVF